MKKPLVKIDTGPAPEIAAHYFYSVQFVSIADGTQVTTMNGDLWVASDSVSIPDIIEAVIKMTSDALSHPNYPLDQVVCQILALNNIDLPRHVMGMQQALADDRRQTEIEILELVSSELMEVLRDKGNSKRLVPKLEFMWASLKAKIAALRNGA
jgi:hypothetical protein